MKCPKCGKLLSKKNTSDTEKDGGLAIAFFCEKCQSKFESFITQFDLEEVFDHVEEFSN